MSSMPPQPRSSGNAVALANQARAKLTITVPRPPALQAGRRKQQVSSFTQYVGLWQTNGGTTVFSTSIPLSGCYNVGTYVCYANLAIGSYPVYGALYDGSNNMLSTTGFTHPSPTTIYANGSYYSKVVSIAPYPVVSKVVVRTPVACEPNRGSQTFSIDVLDADNISISGYVANPFSFTTSAAVGNSANLYIRDPSHNTTIANGQAIAAIGSGTYQYTPALTSLGSDAEIGIALATSYGPIPTLRVGNQNFASGATSHFAIGTEILWTPNGSGVNTQALIFPSGYSNVSFSCGSPPLMSAASPATNIIGGANAGPHDAYVFIGDTTYPGIIQLYTAPNAFTMNQYQGNPTKDPITTFGGSEVQIAGAPQAMTWDPGVQELFVADAAGDVDVLTSPADGFSAIAIGGSYFSGTATHLAVLNNYPSGHDLITVANGTVGLYMVDFDRTAHTFAPSPQVFIYPVFADAAYNSGSNKNLFVRAINGGQGYGVAFDVPSQSTFANTSVPLGTTTSGGAFFEARNGGLSGYLLMADGNSITGFPYSNAASTFSGYPLAPIYTFGGAVINFIPSANSGFIGVNVSGTLNVITNALSPNLYIGITGFAGRGLLTGS